MEADLFIRFGTHPTYAFVQGEDRTLDVVVYERGQGGIYNLTGAAVTLHLPRDGGGSLKRSSTPVRVAASQVAFATSPGQVNLPEHGLATGDAFTVVAQGGGTLPAGLAISTNYKAHVIDDGAFSIQTSAGADVVLTSAGTLGFDMTLADTITNNGTAGTLAFPLSAAFTAAVRAGAAQDLQVAIVLAGKRRVAQAHGALDVYNPIDP